MYPAVVPYEEGKTVVVRVGFAYNEAASLRPKVQEITWQIGPSERADLSVVVVSNRGNDHAVIHMSRAEAAQLAVALVKAGNYD
jgi:hypothetical protein